MTKDQSAQTITSREAADQIGTTARELRVWLRSKAGIEFATRDENNAYAFDPEAVPAMEAAYHQWVKDREAAKAAAKEQAAKAAEGDQ